MAALHARCFPDRPWSAREIEDLLATGTVSSFASPDGMAFLLVRILPPEAEILSLAVHPEERRRGLGSQLVRDFIRAAGDLRVTEMFLEVAADNLPARALYARHRFREIGRRRDYYTRADGTAADALLMRRSDSPQADG